MHTSELRPVFKFFVFQNIPKWYIAHGIEMYRMGGVVWNIN